MKIQVRQSVFETNSSTQHTLCIVRPDESRIKSSGFYAELPDKVVVDINDPEYFKQLHYQDGLDFDNLSLEDKVTILILSASSEYQSTEFIYMVSMIQEALYKYGVDLEINYKKLYDAIDKYGWYYDSFGFINSNINEDNIEAFLFSIDCKYASYCDECSEEPTDEYNKLIDHIRELEKTTNEKDILIYNDRC